MASSISSSPFASSAAPGDYADPANPTSPLPDLRIIIVVVVVDHCGSSNGEEKEKEKEKEKEEEVVIVGGGIAGLATALALRRLGVAAAVLEQGASLRSGGTSLTLSTNGWRVLDALGVADELRAKFLRIQGTVDSRSISPQERGLDLVQTWPQELLDIIHNTPDDAIVKNPFVDRWLWPGLSPSPVAAASNGGGSAVAVVAGDAWHPMTPNLGRARAAL
uniref:FAD-binding domain-containing protein n=1 Tax=Ananas comosus var. bracteatus TaxID=296719 RepID=A0A6V7NJ17_ANACO|nr:unnamed protein product [Ananas comosus var. bracteatus]